MEQAAFSLKGYTFPEAVLNLRGLSSKKHSIEPLFSVEGVYYEKSKEYHLSFTFKAVEEEEDGAERQELVSVVCEAVYEFAHIEKYEDIPSYFFANAIAILFPYVRAFVSTLTLQANYAPMVLPTMNLSSLAGVLKERTTRVNDEA